MLAGWIKNFKLLRTIIFYAANPRATELISRFEHHLNKKDKILDIGSGLCNICCILRKRGYRVMPLDVADFSFISSVMPDIYDGNRMPYEQDEYNCSLLITVLHHVSDPEKLIQEAIRVTSGKIIIIEDIYVNWFHRMLTYFVDSIMNLDFVNHPHTNKTDEEWRHLFQELGLSLTEAKYKYSFVVMKQATYSLEKCEDGSGISEEKPDRQSEYSDVSAGSGLRF